MNEQQVKEDLEIPEEYIEPSEEYYEDDYQEEDRNFDEEEFEDQLDNRYAPQPDNLGGLYGLFKDVLSRKNSLRVSNLTKEELGLLKMPVRDAEFIALLGDTFHHPGIAEFFRKQSRITTDTAMSRGGWFSELFISSKKHAFRDSSSSLSNLPTPNKKKQRWRVFSNDEPQS